MEKLAEFLALFGFEADFEAQLFPTLSQALLGVLAAFVAWLLIHKGQMNSAEENRRIERARILHDLDREYENIMASRCVVPATSELKTPDFIASPATGSSGRSPSPNNNKVAEEDMCLFELVLTRHVLWFDSPSRADGNGPNRYIYVNGARNAPISPDYYVDTLTLHRVVSWSKRVASGLHARIIDREDVCDMWRHILPWAKDNRFSFMAAFFGVSRDFAEPESPRPFGRLSALLRPFRRAGPFNQSVPRHWSGDIAPLYVLIRTVLEEAYRTRRVEILHFVGLDKELLGDLAGATEAMRPRMDPIVRAVIGLPVTEDGSAPTA